MGTNAMRAGEDGASVSFKARGWKCAPAVADDLAAGGDGDGSRVRRYCLASQQQKRLCVAANALLQVTVLQDSAAVISKTAKKYYVVADEEDAVEAAYVRLQGGIDTAASSYIPQAHAKKLMADIREIKRDMRLAAQTRSEPLGYDRRHAAYWAFAGDETRVYVQTHDGEGSAQRLWGFYEGVDSARDVLEWLDVR
jgi:hypothetical protein